MVTSTELLTINTSTTLPVVIKSNSNQTPAFKPIADYVNNSQILFFTNKERAGNYLTPLTANPLLDKIASLRLEDLFANQYFEHESSDGKTATNLAMNLGYNYLLIGENLALGNFNDEESIVSAWMESPGHRANILNGKYSELGVALKTDLFNGEETTIAVQIFGTPLSNCPIPNQSTKTLIDSSTVSIKKMQEEAAILFNNLSTIKDNPQIDRSYYLQKVSEYNYFAKKINDAVLALKNMTDFYNIEVNNYNACIKI